MGTNFVNIGLGLGIPAFLLTLITKYKVFEKEIPIYLGLTAILTSFALDGVINRVEGAIILLVYVITLIIIYQYSLREKTEQINHLEIDVDSSTISETVTKGLSKRSFYGFIFWGFLSLIISSLVLVLLSPRLSSDFKISEYILGLTII